MPLHFTYSTPSEEDDLQQGDIIKRTSRLTQILVSTFPYYSANNNNEYFIVVTQSCDLACRDSNSCKAPYIALAPVRSLSGVVEREVTNLSGSAIRHAANVQNQGERSKIIEFLKKVMNNNNPDYFYLHDQQDQNFPEKNCAFLRLTISLKASDCYNVLKEARILSLTDVFRAKLGWLLGNVYSRVGTDDHIPDHLSANDFKKFADDLLDGICKWVDGKKLSAFEKQHQEKIEEVKDIGEDKLRKMIEDQPTTNYLEMAANRVLKTIQKVGISSEKLKTAGFENPDEVLKKIYTHLMSDAAFKANIKT